MMDRQSRIWSVFSETSSSMPSMSCVMEKKGSGSKSSPREVEDILYESTSLLVSHFTRSISVYRRDLG